MLSLSVKIRETIGRKVRDLREKGILPGVLYGPKTKSLSLEINAKEFDKIYKLVGKSSLFSLNLEGKETPVLIHEMKKDPLTENPIHVDFYQPNLKEEIEAEIPLVFEGEPLAVKSLGGTLVRNIQEITVKALPQNLPHEIKVNTEVLNTFDDSILVKDLILPKEVKVVRDGKDIVALVARPEAVEDLRKPVEEKVEEVEADKEKKETPEEESK